MARRGPRDALLRFEQLLQLHGQLAFAHLVFGEDLCTVRSVSRAIVRGLPRTAHLEMRREPHFLTRPNEPFGGIVLIPFNSVAVVHGKLMVEVVVSLANRDERSRKVVARRVLVVERRLTEPVRERVDAERRLPYKKSNAVPGYDTMVTYVVYEHKSHDPGVHVPAPAVVPEIPGNKGRNCEADHQ